MMRILAGKYKGKALKAPKDIRPTQNVVRKAIFDILGDIAGLSFLELFAGCGAVGFEAASRGVEELTLIENNRECCTAIKENIACLHLEACEFYPKDALGAIEILHKHKRRFDIIFLDPPYHQELSKKALQSLSAYDILAANGLIVIQHFKKDNLPKELGDLVLIKQSVYGDTVLSIYRKYKGR